MGVSPRGVLELGRRFGSHWQALAARSTWSCLTLPADDFSSLVQRLERYAAKLRADGDIFEVRTIQGTASGCVESQEQAMQSSKHGLWKKNEHALKEVAKVIRCALIPAPGVIDYFRATSGGAETSR